MATEKLIVELDAETTKLDAALKKTDSRLDKLDDSVKKTDKSFANFTKGATVVAAAVVAVGAAIVTATAKASAFARELEVAANRSGETVENMQSLAFATNTVGISMEKLGDISKDTNEKVGEFLTTGGGGFQDFADVMSLTAKEANALAEEFKTMTGTDVLQAMTNQMEAAGIGANQMSFALEGMASDATDLIPLLTDSGHQLGILQDEFTSLNATLTNEDIEKIKSVSVELDKFSTTFSQGTAQLIADYSEEITKALIVTQFLGEKTVQAFEVITNGWGNLITIAQAALTDFVNGTETFDEALAERAEKSADVLNEFLGDDYFEVGRKAGKDMADGMNSGRAEGEKEGLSITVRGGKEQTDWEKLNTKERLDVQQKFFKAGSVLADTFFEDNKAIKAGLIVADTAAGIMKAISTSSNIYEGFANAAVVAAMGVAQLSNALSSQKGGGSVSSGGAVASTATPPPEDFQQETSSLELTDSTATGGGTQVITFATDTGDELIDAIGNSLNRAMSEGRV